HHRQTAGARRHASPGTQRVRAGIRRGRRAAGRRGRGARHRVDDDARHGDDGQRRSTAGGCPGTLRRDSGIRDGRHVAGRRGVEGSRRQRIGIDGRSGAVMRTALTSAIVAALLAAADSAGAQPPAGLSLNDAIARALAREPALAAARSEAAAMRGTLAQAELRPNPALTANRQQEPGGMDNQTSVMFEWPLDLFRKTGRVNVATQELEAAGHRVSDQERMMIAEVRLAYGAAAAALRNRELAAELAAAAQRQHALVAARVEAGAAPPLERDTLAIEARRLEAERLTESAAADRALFELKRLLDMDPGEPLSLAEPLERLAPSEPYRGRPIADTAEARSDVREARANMRAAEARVDLARREGRVDLSVFGSYVRMDAGFPQLGVTAMGTLAPIRDVFHYAAVGTTDTLPLLNRRQGDVAAAQARQTGA